MTAQQNTHQNILPLESFDLTRHSCITMEPSLADLVSSDSRTSTFVSIDVLGSTQLKAGENEQDIMATFLNYHKQVKDLAYTHHGDVISITGDGMLCRFQRPEDGVHMAEGILLELALFNKKQNRLTKPMHLRMGIHTGEVRELQGVSSGQWISPTLDCTAKLQQNAPADTIRLSEATHLLLKDERTLFARVGWDAELQMNVFEYRPGTHNAPLMKKLPERARLLVVDADLDDLACLKKALFGRSHEVMTAYTAAQASFITNHWKPHAVLLSMDLPWDSGWNTLGDWRANSALSGMPIVALSRATQDNVIQKSFKMGANGFVRKPLEAQQVLKRLELVLREFYL